LVPHIDSAATFPARARQRQNSRRRTAPTVGRLEAPHRRISILVLPEFRVVDWPAHDREMIDLAARRPRKLEAEFIGEQDAAPKLRLLASATPAIG